MPPPPSPSLPTPRAFLSSLLTNLPPPTSNAATTSNPLPLPPTSKPPLLTLHALFPTLLLPALDLLDRRLLTRFILKEPSIAEEEATISPTTAANPDNNNNAPPPAPAGGKKSSSSRRIIYYALSSTSHSTSSHRPSSRRHHDSTTTHYEIRPHAWSCTCPAFAFSAYNNPALASEPVTYEGGAWEVEEDEDEDDGGGRGAGDRDKEGEEDDENEDDEDAEMLDNPIPIPIPAPEAVRPTSTTGDNGHEHNWWGGLMRGGGDVPLCKHLLASLLAERWDVVSDMVEERVIGREEMAGWCAGWGG